MGQSGGVLRGSSEDAEDDVKRQVDSDDKNQKPIYQLVNVKDGGGKLVDLMKENVRHVSSSLGSVSRSVDAFMAQRQTESYVDKKIRELVEPLLYNGGRGKMIPLSKIWAHRHARASNLSETEEHSDLELGGRQEEHRFVCWKLEERGFVGETGLHICFLLSTATHMLLARKLLTIFPLLINDIYTCDEYFGESCLHMGIVNEDVRIVKLLLDHGANVHERCLGSFFLPSDQKEFANSQIRRLVSKTKSSKDAPQSRQDELTKIDLNSNQLANYATNYEGYVYWGEYPLSFTVCLGLADCYKLLLAKGADPNRQDSNGNTSLHMAVVANRIDMFDLCFANGADLNIVNKQNLSVLTLAAKLRRVDMFFHIMSIQRHMNWILCDVGFAELPLIDVDSIRPEDGSYNPDSALSIVVFGGSNEHLQMLDGLLSNLLQTKWNTAVRGWFYMRLLLFSIFLLIFMVCFVMKFTKIQSKTSTRIKVACEMIVVSLVCHYLWSALVRLAPSKDLYAIGMTLIQAPEIGLNIFSCSLIISCVPLRLFSWGTRAEDFILALVMLSLPLKLLFFCRASRQFGSFVVMIYKIVVNDVLCFVVFLLIFVAGFSQSFSIIFKTHSLGKQSNETLAPIDPSTRNYFLNPFDGIIAMHVMALNEFSMVFDEFDATEYPMLARLFFCLYMILVSILLINMLIAMLGKTFQDIASQPNENLRQWARALLLVERLRPNRERLNMLRNYSHPPISPDGRSCPHFGVTWALTDQDRARIKSIEQIKSDNKNNSARLARKRGR